MPQSIVLFSHFNLLLFIILAPLVKAYTLFETTCSAPNPQSEFLFVSSPDTRGTLNILWSSLFTILACTWTLQHPNVPKQRNDCDPGVLGDIKWTLKAFGNSALLMVVAAMAPEMVIGMAVEDLIEARKNQEMMADYVFKDQVTWSLRHSYFAMMRGFAIRSKKPSEAVGETRSNSRGGKIHCLSAAQLYDLRCHGVMDSLPDIRAEEIKDKSKSDTLGKFIAIGQITWTIVQIIVRAAKKLPVSPLEIAVVAFAACAIIVYGLYMRKPQRVSSPIAIYDYIGQEDTLEEIIAKCLEMAQKEKRAQAASPAPENPSTNRFLKTIEYWGSGIVTGVGAAVFGGVHVIAWNFAFPTTIELIWWRCASVYSAAFPLGLAVSITFMVVGGNVPEKAIFGVAFFLAGLYIVARLFILVEMFRTLFFLPAGSFVSTWASDIPHFG